MNPFGFTETERCELDALGSRIGEEHLRERITLETDRDAHVFRRGTRFLDLDKWYSVALLRTGLKLTGLYGRAQRNALRIQTRHNDVSLQKLPVEFDGLTLLHLSDLHLDMSEAHLARLIECVQVLHCDLCVLTGDFRFATAGAYAPALDAVATLRPHLNGPTYAVLGNHDTIRMVPRLEGLDIRLLLNESVRLERNGSAIHLAGVDDAHYFRTHDLRRAARDIPDDACSILLSHTPETYRDAADAGFDLMLCGHTHGGQICLPGGVPILTDSEAPRTFAKGPWRFRGLTGYTSVGCGSSILDVRINCLPEVTVHCLRRAPPTAG